MNSHLLLLCLGFFALCQFGVIFTKDGRPRQEEPCSREGGICYEKKYCEDIIKEGLCPKQQHLGIECCHRIVGPVQSTPSGLQENCGTKGAVCMERCPVVDETGLCEGDLKCCVLM